MKKIFNLRIAITAILLFSFTFLSSGCSCGGKQKASADLTYWRLFDDKTVFEPLLSAYQTSNPQIKITYEKKDHEEYYNNLLDELAAGKGPDMFMIRNDWLPAFKDKIDTVPSDIISQEDYRKTFVDVASNELIEGDKIYGIPYTVNTLALIFNQDLLSNARYSKPPANWNEFMTYSKKLTRLKGSYVSRAGTALGTTTNLGYGVESSPKIATDILSAMMMQSGDQMVSDDKKSATFGLPQDKPSGGDVYPGTSALNFFASFSMPSKETYTWNTKMETVAQSFAKQKVAMIFGYSDIISQIQNLNPNIRLYTAKMPQVKGTDEKMTIASYWIEVVSKNSQQKQQAWDVIKSLSDVDPITKIVTATHRPPSRKDLVMAYSSDPVYGAFSEQLDSARTWYKGKQPDKIYTIFASMINGVSRGQKPQNSIDKARNSVTSLLLKD